MKNKFKLNTALILLEIIAFIITWFINGWSLFVYYTQESNLLFFFSCICYEIWMLRNPDYEEKDMPRWIYLLKYISTSMLIVTCLIVVCVLAPMGFTLSISYGFELLVGNANLFHHFLCPIIGTYAFVKVDRMQPISLKNNFAALIPTTIYAALTVWANIVGLLYGPYPFLHVYEQSILTSILWIFVIWFVAYILAFFLRWLNIKIHK